MKPKTPVLAGILGLMLALTGCVALESETGPPGTTPGAPLAGQSIEVPGQQSIPAPVIPEIKPYSAEGLKERIGALPKDSVARQVLAGKHPFEDAIPGSERVLIAEVFAGESYVALPEIEARQSVNISLHCQEPTPVSLGVYEEPTGAQIAGGNGECGPAGGSGIGFGWGPQGTSGYLHMLPSGDQQVAVTVNSYASDTVSGSS